MKNRFVRIFAFVGSLWLWGAAGCTALSPSTPLGLAGDGPVLGSVTIEDGTYSEVFEAAREVLGDYRFGINRVDAARGVITTFPKRTVGLGSPWDPEQTTLGQELEDLANQQERTVRVEFERAPQEDAAPTRAIVEVQVYRIHRPNWRVETESMRLSTHARSRDSIGRVEDVDFREPIGHDTALADRIAVEIMSRFR